MLHKPTERKLPRKYENHQKQQSQEIKRAYSKPLMKQPQHVSKSNQRQPSVRGRVTKVQQKIDSIVGKMSNSQMQTLLIEEIKGIKNQLKQIKHHIGISGSNHKKEPVQQHYEEDEEQQQNVHSFQQNNSGHHQKIEHSSFVKENKVKENLVESRTSHGTRNKGVHYKLFEKPKELIDVGKIQPYMRDFKIEVTKQMCPYYNGYHKKSSKPVIIKYCSQNRSLESLFNLYQKLWKNIVKAKQICINKVFDINQPLATYILVLQANKYSLNQMLQHKVATVSQIICSLLKALQFFHDCGYLYRNIHPSHVMYSYQGDIILLDLKNMKRFVDIKGKHIPVSKQADELVDEFASNSKARGLKQGRKDDLESLGYLALYILDGQLPWTINNLVQVRSKLTLKDLCGKYPALMEYMILIAQMQTEDVPNYNRLGEILANL